MMRKSKNRFFTAHLCLVISIVLAIAFVLSGCGEEKSEEVEGTKLIVGDTACLAGDTIKALLVKIAERWNSDEALVISTAEADALKAYFAKNAKALLDKGVEIKQVNGLKTLFSIAPADGSYKVNFGEAEFEAFFKSFLRPQMVELLF